MNLPLLRAPEVGADVDEILLRYEERYLREFGYVLPRDFASVEFVNARVAVIGLTDEIKLPRSAKRGRSADALIGSRPVYFEEAGDFVEATLYERARLARGAAVEGPAIVEQTDSTVVLPPGASARVDEYLNIVISVNG
jgi:N-methylhydantoinase A